MKTRRSDLYGRVRGGVGKTALVLSTDQANVAIFSPAGTPTVLHFPVVLRGIGTVADKEDTVVKFGTATAREDTTTVELEARLVGFDGNRHGAEVDGRLEGVFVSLSNIFKPADRRVDFGSFYLVTDTGLRGVTVIFFGIKTFVLDDVFKTVIHQTTIATLVAERSSAIN